MLRGELPGDLLAGGSTRRSVTDLEAGTHKWINEWNKSPKPFARTKTADEILATLAACCERINDSLDGGIAGLHD